MKRDSSNLQGRIIGGLLIVLLVFGAVRLFPLLFRFVELAAVNAMRFWWLTLIIVFAVAVAIRLRRKPESRSSAELHVLRPPGSRPSSDDEDPKEPIH